MESATFPPVNMSAPPPSIHVPPPNLTPAMPNLSIPPPTMLVPTPVGSASTTTTYTNRFDNRNTFNSRSFFKPFQSFGPRGPLGPMTLEDFDGKRLRKSVMRKTVDYNSSIIKALENRIWQRDFRDRRALQPDVMYYPDLMPPPSYIDNAMNCVTTRFVKTATNKMRCPIFCMAWTPEGRRLVTGASSGEFTLWNGLTFNFETILQAHDSPVRTMVWSHNDSWMVTGDHAGYVKYWQSNMNNVKMFQAHKEALRGISFSPTDNKFVTCSDDGTLRIWDFLRCHEERILRGHGADVKCVHWHPQKGLIISGSKDNQQPIKLWDPKTGQSLATLHAHKSTVMDLKWNENGNWLITASRDHLLKLFDVRNLSQEVQTFRGHKKEASSVAWHPIHEGLFSSGGSDGSIMFWHVGADKEVGAIEQAHDSIVWTLAWHPLGHILCSGSNDHTSKFWTRNRPGDLMRDKYNLNTLPAGLAGLEDADIDEPSVIPGMGPEDKVETNINENATIPGLDLDIISVVEDRHAKLKKVPYSKPIPRNFQAQWNETEGEDENDTINEVISQIVENTPGVVPLQKIEPSAIIVYGKLLPVEPGSKLEQVIAEGPEALKKYIASGAIEELHDVMPHEDDSEYNDAYLDEDDDTTHDPPAMITNVDIKLPPPLPSSKLAQTSQPQVNPSNQDHITVSTHQSTTSNSEPKERVRKSRFSDINDSSNKDLDMRQLLPPVMEGPFGNIRRMAELNNLMKDVDYRKNSDVSLRFQDFFIRNPDVSSRNVDFSSRNTDISSGNLNLPSRNPDHSSRNSDLSSRNSDISARHQDTSSRNIDMLSRNLDIPSRSPDISLGKSEICSRNQDISRNSDISSRNTDISPRNLDISGRNTDHSIRIPDHSIRNPDHSIRNPDHSLRNLELSSRHPELSSRHLDISSRNQDLSSRNLDFSSRNLDNSSRNSDISINIPETSPRNSVESFGKMDEDSNFGKNSDYDDSNARPYPMDVDYRNRFDNYNNSDSSKFPGSFRDTNSPNRWSPNENYSKQNNNNSQQGHPNESFGFRGSNQNFPGNQNGSFGPNGPHNFRMHGNDFSGGPPVSQTSSGQPFGNNFRSEGGQFRPDGQWNMQRSEGFRGRGGFNPRLMMRGGPGPIRNPRGFPGPRGGMWLPPRGNGPLPGLMRGRNLF